MKKIKLPFFIEKFLAQNYAQIYTTCLAQTFDDKGKRTRKKEFLGRSLTANFLQTIYSGFNNNDQSGNFPNTGGYFNNNVSIVNATGAQTSLSFSQNNFWIAGSLGDTVKGIVCGTGTNAPTPKNYALETPIASGVLAGQLVYQVQTALLGVIISGQNTTLILSRFFNNNSGGGITVNELGLFMETGNANSNLVYRDTINNGILVPNLQSLNLQITFQSVT